MVATGFDIRSYDFIVHHWSLHFILIQYRNRLQFYNILRIKEKKQFIEIITA